MTGLPLVADGHESVPAINWEDPRKTGSYSHRCLFLAIMQRQPLVNGPDPLRWSDGDRHTHRAFHR